MPSGTEDQVPPTSSHLGIKSDNGWVARAQEVADGEKRWQPWKQIMQDEEVLQGFEGKDIARVRGEDDVQHSGVGA